MRFRLPTSGFLPFFLWFPQRSPVLHSLCTIEHRFSVAMIRLLPQSIASADVRCLERCQIAAELTFPVVLESELLEGFPGHVTAEMPNGRFWDAGHAASSNSPHMGTEPST
jgi:hypothetical protein